MANYTATCNLIHEKILSILERRDEARYRFAPRGTVKRLFERDRHFLLKKFFQSLAPVRRISDWADTISEAIFVERVEARKLYNFWAALIFATCSIDAAMTALRRLIAVDTWPVPTLELEGTRSTFLPLSRAQLGDLLGNPADADRFFDRQACFCPVVLCNREEVIVRDANCQRLPYLEEEFLAEGSFGTVYRVKVAKNHFYDGHADAARAYNGQPQDLARKDYFSVKTSHARDEYEIMKKILGVNFGRSASNIVQSLGCLWIESRYSLFMPLAICDLYKFMMELHPMARLEPHSKAEIVLSAAGLASGLHFLHSGFRTETMEELVCYHMDLTPSNVLIFFERDRYVWKLSDFGMARVKVRSRETNYPPNDFLKLFVPRRRLMDPSPPPTVNRRGEGTYLPPESLASQPKMTTGSDVWALGCILSAVFAYVRGGAAGFNAYALARQNHYKSDDSDRFFLRGMQFSSHKLHPEVKKWHDKLKSEALSNSRAEGMAFARILNFLQDYVLLIRPEKRCTAHAVELVLQHAYQTLQGIQQGSHPSTIRRIAGILSSSQGHKNTRPETVNLSTPLAEVVFHHFESFDDFKGLSISPDASCLAYWTDYKIILYTSETLSFAEEAEEAEETHRSHPSQWLLSDTNHFMKLKEVCLTRRYLVASTTLGNYLYIFGLHDSAQVDINLSSMHRIALDMPAISNIVMSPNSQTLAFVARDERNSRKPGTIFYINPYELITASTQKQSCPSENGSAQSVESLRLSKSHALFRKRILLDWPAADIMQLTISDENDAYIVVRPELDLENREHKIPIARVWTDPESNQLTFDVLNVFSLGFEGSTTDNFFTTYCVVNDRNTCALVTRRRRLLLQSFKEDKAAGVDDSHEITHYRIVKLFNVRPTGRLLALGNASSKQQLLLMAIDFAPTLCVRELAKIPRLRPDDDMTAVAVDHHDGVRVIVASLTGVGRRDIFRITVFR